MPTRQEFHANTRFDMELLMDQTSVSELLQVVADICAAKGTHIRENWQDEKTASKWTIAAAAIEKVADSKAIERVS